MATPTSRTRVGGRMAMGGAWGPILATIDPEGVVHRIIKMRWSVLLLIRALIVENWRHLPHGVT